MIKVYINNEEVLCDKNIVIKKEMLNTSSTILNNVYPKSWETTHDYTTNYYYPLDYSNCKITDIREIPAEEGQTIEGTSFNINVDLSKEYSFDSFKGNTTQNGTPTPDSPIPVNVVSGDNTIDICGKNLFDKTKITRNYSYNYGTQGIVPVPSSNNARATISPIDSIRVEPNTTYTLTFLASGFRYALAQMTDGYVSNGDSGWKTDTTYTITTSATTKYIGFNFAKTDNSSISDDDWNSFISSNIQLEKGNQATEYEEYNGNTYEINLGKNLLDTSNARTDKTWLTRNSDGSLTLNYPSGSNVNFTDLFTNNINIPTGNYVLKIFMEGTFVGGNLVIKNINGNNVGQTSIRNGNTITITNSDIGNIQFYVVSAGTNCTIKLELEKGIVATEYAPYKTPIELCKIGDYQDRIYKDNGKWYIEKQIGKVVLDGSETWYIDDVYQGITQFRVNVDNIMWVNDNIVRVVSNYFVGVKYANSWAIDNSATTQPGRIRLMTSLYSNVDDFKTWLSTHNTTVYYVLATLTTTEITDTELINQLESIELIEGINNISVSGNLPIIMNLHYNYVTHKIDTILLFSGIVKNTGNISLNPREPHYSSIEVLGYETFLSEGETLDFVIYEKTIEEAIDLVINTISDYGIIKGNINIKNPNDIIGAYSTKDKTAYDVFNYIADITQSRWTTRIIDENTIAIDFYDPDLMTNGIDLDFTQEFFANNNIIDMQYNYGTRDYRNKQVMNSSAVYSNIETNETIIADGYQTQFNTTDKIGEITKMTLNGTEVIVKTKDEYELGYTCDFYYTPGNNYFESADLVSTGGILVIDYYAIIQGREILLNNTEINRVSSMTGRKGVISRYEDRNDATTTTELSQIGQSYLRYKGSPEIILTIESLNDIWDIGEKVEFNNAPLNELATEYMVKKKTIHYIPTVDNIFYEFELTSNFNSENAINYFDNQRSKNKGNIGQGETISRNIDISNTANVIFYDVDIQEVSIDGDNILNNTLNSPLVQ